MPFEELNSDLICTLLNISDPTSINFAAIVCNLFISETINCFPFFFLFNGLGPLVCIVDFLQVTEIENHILQTIFVNSVIDVEYVILTPSYIVLFGKESPVNL